MNLVDDDAPTRLREVIRDRTASDTEPTKMVRAASCGNPPLAHAAVPNLDTAATARRAQTTSSTPAPQAQTVVRPLRTRVAGAPPAARSHRRELALRCGLAIAVSAAAFGVALASTNSLPASEQAPAENLVPPKSTETDTATPVAASSPSSAGATAPNARNFATSPSPAQVLDAKAVTAEGHAPPTLVAQPADAARLLATGAYASALDAYRALAASEPDEPVYAVIARVLARNLGARCDRSPTPGDPTCSTHENHDAHDTRATTATPSSPR